MFFTEAFTIKITEEVVKSLVGIFLGESWERISKLGSILDRKNQQMFFDAKNISKTIQCVMVI
ncbi:MAG: hypothetical protein ACFB2X_01710 [Rivularia sp. (in: cyanobacteria)]